jgi:hypothetical protein
LGFGQCSGNRGSYVFLEPRKFRDLPLMIMFYLFKFLGGNTFENFTSFGFSWAQLSLALQNTMFGAFRGHFDHLDYLEDCLCLKIPHAPSYWLLTLHWRQALQRRTHSPPNDFQRGPYILTSSVSPQQGEGFQLVAGLRQLYRSWSRIRNQNFLYLVTRCWFNIKACSKL